MPGTWGWYDLEVFSQDLWEGDDRVIVERTADWFERFKLAVSPGPS